MSTRSLHAPILLTAFALLAAAAPASAQARLGVRNNPATKTVFLSQESFVLEAGVVATITKNLSGADGIALLGDNFIVSQPNLSNLMRVDRKGVVSNFAPFGLQQCYGISPAKDGTIFVANWGQKNVKAVTPWGQVSTFMQGNSQIGNVFVAPNGDVIVPYFYTGVIERVTRGGQRTTIGKIPANKGLHGILFDNEGQLFAAGHLDGVIYRIEDDGSATPFAKLPGQMGNILWYQGNFFATGYDTHQVYRIERDGTVEVFAGSGIPGGWNGPPLNARFRNPNGLIGEPKGGYLYVSESGGAIRRIQVLPGRRR